MNSNDLKLNDDSENFDIECQNHGTHKWEGHFICSNCYRTYTYEEAEKLDEEGGICDCGKKLLPADDNDTDFSGVAICSICFVNYRAVENEVMNEEGISSEGY